MMMSVSARMERWLLRARQLVLGHDHFPSQTHNMYPTEMCKRTKQHIQLKPQTDIYLEMTLSLCFLMEKEQTWFQLTKNYKTL